MGALLQPYARLGWDGKLHYAMADVEYREFPLMRQSALMHCFEQEYNKIEEALHRSHAVSKAVIQTMHDVGKDYGVQLVVAGISSDPDTQDTLSFCKKEGIPATDISVDLRIKENTNLPFDAHPSRRANQEYADKLGSFLRHHILAEAKESASTARQKSFTGSRTFF